MSLEIQLRSATTAFQNSQSEISKLISNRQKLEAQLTENIAVKTEFDQIQSKSNHDSTDNDINNLTLSTTTTNDPIIFKLIGNMLIKQDTDESKTNVNRRIEFLKTEQSKIDQNLQSLQTLIEKQKTEVVKLQTQIQQESATQKLSDTHISSVTPNPK